MCVRRSFFSSSGFLGKAALVYVCSTEFFLFLWVLRKGGVSLCVFDGVFLFLWVLRKGGVNLCGTPWDLHITIMPYTRIHPSLHHSILFPFKTKPLKGHNLIISKLTMFYDKEFHKPRV